MNQDYIFMLKIGLTGGIGAGKSTIAKIFEVLGIPVFDADAAAKKIMNEDEDLKAQLIHEFGEMVYNSGLIDRKYLSDIVFNNSFKLEQLNALVHPHAIKAGEDWAVRQSSPYVIKEAALLFESGSASNLDYVIGVHAPKHLRIHRVMKRDHITREQIEARMRNQIDDSIREKLCDFNIYNNEIKVLIPQVLVIHKKISDLTQ